MNDHYQDMDPAALARLLEQRLSRAGASPSVAPGVHPKANGQAGAEPDAVAKARAELAEAEAAALRQARAEPPEPEPPEPPEPHRAEPPPPEAAFDGQPSDARAAAFLDVLKRVLAHPGVQAAMKFAAETHFAAEAIPNQWPPPATVSRPNPPAPPKPAAPPPKLKRWQELRISETTYKRLKKRGALA